MPPAFEATRTEMYQVIIFRGMHAAIQDIQYLHPNIYKGGHFEHTTAVMQKDFTQKGRCAHSSFVGSKRIHVVDFWAK